MLSHEDERRLAAIERQMLSDDPDFVLRFRRGAIASLPDRTPRRPLRGAFTATALCVLSALAALGLMIALVGLLVASSGLIISGATMAAATAWAFRRLHRDWLG